MVDIEEAIDAARASVIERGMLKPAASRVLQRGSPYPHPPPGGQGEKDKGPRKGPSCRRNAGYSVSMKLRSTGRE